MVANVKEITRIDWHRKVDEALITLLNSLDEPPNFRRIAEEVAASPYHFHKQFKDLTGETFKACADRLRLEKAMTMLREDKSITEIAFDCGYATVEMLSKAIRKTWGMSPTHLRRQSSWHPFIPSSVGVHYSRKNEHKTWFYAQGGKEIMETKIVQFDEKIFYGYKIIGDYWQLPNQWEHFMGTVGKNKIHHLGKEYVSVFIDSSDSIPQDQKRAFAGFVTEKKIEEKFDFEEVLIPSGLYAVTVHFGSSESIGPVWNKWMTEWLPSSGWAPDYSRPNYEWYQNHLDNPELLLTFLVTAVQRKE
jgi:AraC family transcriptional regulator